MHIIESVCVTELSPSLMKVHYGTLHILLNKANSLCPSRSINFSSPSVRPAISSVNIASSGGFQQHQGFRRLERRQASVVRRSVLAVRCVSKLKDLEKRTCRWWTLILPVVESYSSFLILHSIQYMLDLVLLMVSRIM